MAFGVASKSAETAAGQRDQTSFSGFGKSMQTHLETELFSFIRS